MIFDKTCTIHVCLIGDEIEYVNRKYEKLLKMIYLNKYCTDFMFLLVMVCVTYSSTISSLIIFNFPLIFKTSFLFVDIYVHMF